MSFELILFDNNPTLVKAWAEAFKDQKVEIVRSDFRDLKDYDCLVSPANSFGIMDGGIDAVISETLPKVQRTVKEHIASEYHGYQPVGTSLLVEAGEDTPRWLAHTPTMRVPGPLIGAMRINIYNAFWALLNEIERHNRDQDHKIARVACPGLGTKIGKVEPQVAAKLMELAYTYFQKPVMSAIKLNHQREAELMDII